MDECIEIRTKKLKPLRILILGLVPKLQDRYSDFGFPYITDLSE